MKECLKSGRKALFIVSSLPFFMVWLAAALCYSGGKDLTLLRIDSSRFIFLQVCSQCHEPERGYQVIVDAGEWAATVSRMLVKGQGHVTLEKVNQFAMIMKYGTEYQEYQEAFFEARCSRCHEKGLMQDPGESVTTWHNRTAALPKDSASWITDEEYELILHGLRSKGNI